MKVVMTWTNVPAYLFADSVSLIASIPSLLGILIYKDETSIFTRIESSGIVRSFILLTT